MFGMAIDQTIDIRLAIATANLHRFYVGPSGRLRASHRELVTEQLEGLSEDEYRERMTDLYVYHPHTRRQPLSSGEIVELDISLWPGGMIFDAGEAMRLEVKGRLPILPEFDGLDKDFKNFNKGKHTVHSGADRSSRLIVNLRTATA